MDAANIGEAVREWAQKRGMKVTSHRINIETGDPGDPRESGFRRETIELSVELTVVP
jgi:uncharacterized OsmC-like protein